MLKKPYRIKKNREFRQIFQNGRGIPSRYVVLYHRTHQLSQPRFGFVVSKKVGGAVVRNRIKRILREIIHQNLPQIRTDVDIILIARPAIKGISVSEVEQSLIRLLSKHHLLRV